MFSRLVIALGMSALLAAGLNNLDMGKLKTATQDKFDRVELSVLDSALVAYHSTHNSTLPAALNDIVLKQLNVSGIDISKYTYRKLTNNKFELAFMPQGATEGIKSFHSGLDLGRAYAYNFELGQNQSDGTTDGDETDVDVSKKSVFIGDNVMIHGSVKIGDGSYGDGKHTFTHNYTIGGNANVNSDQVNIADNTEIGENANIRNYVEIIGEDISIGDRVTLWSEATVGDGVTIANADKGELTFQTAIPAGTTIRRTGAGAGNTTFYSGSTIQGGSNEIYNESDGNIDIYTKLPKDTIIKRTGKGKGDIVYNLGSMIGGSHTIQNDSDAPIEINCDISEGTNFKRGGYGAGSVTLAEEASLNGECGITNETGGKVELQTGLNDNTISYTGSTNAGLIVSGIALLGKISEFNNNGKNSVTFAGRMYDGAKINLDGQRAGAFYLRNGVNIEGQCTFINESYGTFELKNVNVPDGVVLKNISENGGFYLVTSGSGVVDIEPGTEFVVYNDGALYNWNSLKLKSGTLKIKGGSIILDGGFGGTFISDATESVQSFYYGVTKFDWNGEEVRSKINNVGSGGRPERHVSLYTTKIGKYTDVESTVNTGLYGTFEDNVKIRISGESNFGAVYFYSPGIFGGNIDINYTAGIGGSIQFYNELNGLENFTYNSAVAGYLTVSPKVKLGRNILINNESSRSVRINSGVSIGDDVTIDISADNTSDITISQDVPAGTYLAY